LAAVSVGRPVSSARSETPLESILPLARADRYDGGMAQRLENPDEDDLGQGGVVLDTSEFEDFLKVLAANGIKPEATDLIREMGFFAPITRDRMGPIFQMYKMQADISVMAICREDSLDAMKRFIIFMIREGSWPKNLRISEPNTMRLHHP
jgi:hypothetical protein